MIRWVAIVLVLAIPAAAQERAVDRKKLEYVRNLPPEERAKLRKRMERLKQMPKEERERLRENMDQVRSLPPEEREALRKRVGGLSREEREEYGELATDFFHWGGRREVLRDFPRGLFFSWLKKEKPEEIVKIRALAPGPEGGRVDAFVPLYDEFRNIALTRAERHAGRHGCVPPEKIAGLRDAPPEELWGLLQKIHRECGPRKERHPRPR